MNIELQDVTKTFQNIPVVRHLTFSVNPGQIVGLLGPNGAGKTTTLRMILDILRPTEGTIRFENQRINRKIRNRIGYLPEERGIYQKYRVIDVLTYMGRLKNLSRSKSRVESIRLLDRFEMIEYVEEPVGHLSKGLQQKLQFLVAIIHDPEFLILDEPFWGLDPINQEFLREKIRGFRQDGKAVLLSTHQLNEAEALCDYFILIDHGQILLKGTMEDIRQKFAKKIIIVESPDDLSVLREIHDIRKIAIENSRALLYVDDQAPVKQILREIINTLNITRLELYKPSLNDIFMETITNRKQDPA